MNTETILDELTFSSMVNVMQSGMWLLNDLETYLRPLKMSQARLAALLMLKQQDRKDLKAKEIALLTGKSRPAVTRMIEKLEKDGLISIQEDSDDGRAKRLNLTRKGNEMLDTIIPGYNIRVNRMSCALSTEEKQQLNAILKKLNFLDEEKVLI